jgi:hypothetical protein
MQVNAAGDLCAICQEKMHAPILLRCKHIFCEDCVSEWSVWHILFLTFFFIQINVVLVIVFNVDCFLHTHFLDYQMNLWILDYHS